MPRFYETPPDESDKQYYFIIIRLLSFVKRRKPNYCFVRYVLIAKIQNTIYFFWNHLSLDEFHD